MGEIVEMIDLHAHILPGLDDGPKALEESIKMCWMAYKDGVRTMVATPHTLNGLYQNDRETILTKVKELNAALLQSAICNLPSAIKILPGADVHFCEEIFPQLDQRKVTTIGDGKKYLSIEFPFHGIPYRAEEVLFQLMARGIIPIISHPERNLEIGQRPLRYYEMIRAGCLGQVTGMSLTGGFGHGIKRIAEKLLSHRLLHFIGSDAHSVNGRPPILSSAVRAVKKILGKEEARRMVTDYPRAILEGTRPDVPEPIPFH